MNININFDINNYEEVKTMIRPRLINGSKEVNPIKVCNPLIGDIQITYGIPLDSNEEGQYTAAITYDYLKFWGITPMELHAQAIANLKEDGYKVKDLGSILGMPGCAPGMYVLTNRSKLNGAAGILSPYIMEMVKDEIDSQIYIIPSSVHEVIILDKRAAEEDKVPYIVDMINEINRTEVSPDDKLSDHLYSYDYNLDIMTIVK